MRHRGAASDVARERGEARAVPVAETALRGALEAAEEGLIKPILVGPKEKIQNVAKSSSLSLDEVERVVF